MAAKVFDYPIDVHSGGIDLKFPHHSNELAQLEAYYDKPQWVNYFIHTGHLAIDGLKMSKSLKNFITIKNLLEKQANARQLRLLFLLHKYDVEMNYHKNTALNECIAKDHRYKEFFMTMKACLR